MRSDTLPFMLALAFAAAAGAQTPDPARPNAKAPEIGDESVFKSYRPHQEPELASWTELNEEVAKAGGHVGIFGAAGRAARGAAAHGKSEPPTPGSPVPSKPAAQGSGGGHGAH